MDELEKRKRAVVRRERHTAIGYMNLTGVKGKKYKRAVAAIDRCCKGIEAELAEGKRYSEKRIRSLVFSARDAELKKQVCAS